MARRQATGVPGWVKGFMWAGLIAVIVAGASLATGHGPWQHMNMAGMH